jgi:hypothetical protein
LLALFLTILFVVKGSIMFPAAAALGWAVLVYIGVDFGFWGKVFALSPSSEQVWRASGEAILAATLVVFLFAYLNLNRWHVRYSHITLIWLAFLAALVALAWFEAPIASGIARVSLLAIAFLGFGLVVYLSYYGFDRAVLLIPTWFLLVVWTIGLMMTVTGYVTNDIIGPAVNISGVASFANVDFNFDMRVERVADLACDEGQRTPGDARWKRASLEAGFSCKALSNCSRASSGFPNFASTNPRLYRTS